jgi:hypothetical protein
VNTVRTTRKQVALGKAVSVSGCLPQQPCRGCPGGHRLPLSMRLGSWTTAAPVTRRTAAFAWMGQPSCRAPSHRYETPRTGKPGLARL